MIKGSEFKMRKIDSSCFIAKDVELIGEIHIGYNTSIWDGVTIMSNIDKTIIGYNTNIQNDTVIYNDFGLPTIVGNVPQPTTRPDSPVPSLQGPCDRSLKSEVPCGSCLNWR